MVHDLLADGSQQEACETTTSPRTEDDEIRTFRGLEQRVRRRVVHDRSSDRCCEPGCIRSVNDTADECIRSVAVHPRIQEFHAVGSAATGVHVVPGVDRLDIAAVNSALVDGPLERPPRRLRAVNAHHDSMLGGLGHQVTSTFRHVSIVGRRDNDR